MSELFNHWIRDLEDFKDMYKNDKEEFDVKKFEEREDSSHVQCLMEDLREIEKERKKIDPTFLYFDFQGWPVTKKTLRQLLISIGAEESENKLSFDIDNPILDIYPETLNDDGMGYGGGSEMFFTDANITEDNDSNKHIYLWRDKSNV